uniref:calcineurin-like phosphoesterase C-terminal domain-containing protein n=1 Tax=uncultured Draconibacterium sp. TaxID=1573823 RepID=UPI0032163BBF
MKQFLICFVFVLQLLNTSFAQQEILLERFRGTVFLDKNQNGERDADEKGIKGIPVSNGDTIIITNKRGEFRLNVGDGKSIFPIISSGYKIVGSSVGNSNFRYIHENADFSSEKTIEFPLIKEVQNSKFRIGAVGDVQVDDLQQMKYANKTIIQELVAKHDLAFNIFLGDLVNNNTSYLNYINDMLVGIPSQSWTVIGNHDRVIETDKQDQAFNSVFGASHYSFNYADVHFIVLNNIYSDGTRKYEGRVNDTQLRFIANDLALVPNDMLVVICQHIPMVQTKNKAELLALLEAREQVLILSGHTHKVGRHFLSENVTELTVGASCGNWWIGEKDWQGIPSAMMQCGTPRNYFVIDFNKNKFNFTFKGIGLDDSYQMDIWVAGQDSVDNYLNGIEDFKGNEVVANIFGGSDSTIVRMQIDSGKWITMEKVNMLAPSVSRLITMNKIGGYPTRFSRKGLARKSPSPHVWVGYLPDDIKKGVHKIRIIANDKYGFQTTGNRVIIY